MATSPSAAAVAGRTHKRVPQLLIFAACLVLTGCPRAGPPQVVIHKGGNKLPSNQTGGNKAVAGDWSLPGGKWETTETLLLTNAQRQESYFPNSLRVSREGTRYAFARKTGDRQQGHWVIDGKAGETFQNLYYGSDMTKPDPPLSQIDRNKADPLFAFTVDGKHYAYACVMRVEGSLKPEYVDTIFIDGKRSPVARRLSGIHGLALSRDGSYAFYSASTIDSRGPFYYVDDQRAFDYGWATFLAVSVGPPIRLAFLQDFGKTLYLGGRTEPGPIEHFRFSDNGKTYTYVTQNDGEDVAIVNGKPHKRFGNIRRPYQLSADGEHILYIAGNGIVFDNKYFDMKTTPSFPPTLSPDGTHWACRAGNRVVIDGVPGKEYHSVCGSDRDGTPFIAFSRDGKHVAHAVVIEITHEKEPNEYFAAMIRDGAEEKRFAWVSSEAVFSPDGRHLAYLSSDTADGKGDRHLTINGARFGKPHGVLPEFSPDSKSIGFIARRPGEIVPVLDGQEQKSYDAIGPEGTRVGFNKNGAYTFVGTREGNYYWVEIRRK